MLGGGATGEAVSPDAPAHARGTHLLYDETRATTHFVWHMSILTCSSPPTRPALEAGASSYVGVHTCDRDARVSESRRALRPQLHRERRLASRLPAANGRD